VGSYHLEPPLHPTKTSHHNTNEAHTNTNISTPFNCLLTCAVSTQQHLAALQRRHRHKGPLTQGSTPALPTGRATTADSAIKQTATVLQVHQQTGRCVLCWECTEPRKGPDSLLICPRVVSERRNTRLSFATPLPNTLKKIFLQQLGGKYLLMQSCSQGKLWAKLS